MAAGGQMATLGDISGGRAVTGTEDQLPLSDDERSGLEPCA